MPRRQNRADAGSVNLCVCSALNVRDCAVLSKHHLTRKGQRFCCSLTDKTAERLAVCCRMISFRLRVGDWSHYLEQGLALGGPWVCWDEGLSLRSVRLKAGYFGSSTIPAVAHKVPSLPGSRWVGHKPTRTEYKMCKG